MLPKRLVFVCVGYLAVGGGVVGDLTGFVAAFVTILNLGEATRRPEATISRRYLPGVARVAVASFLVVMIPLVASDRFYRSQGSLRRFGFGVSEHRFPVRAMAFVREHGLPTPVLHALGDGGYLLFEGGPESVYVDGRLEVYGSENLERAFRVTWTAGPPLSGIFQSWKLPLRFELK